MKTGPTAPRWDAGPLRELIARLDPALVTFACSVLAAADINHREGKGGGTCRMIPLALEAEHGQLAPLLRAAPAGFALSEYAGNLSLTIFNDARAGPALERIEAAVAALRGQEDRPEAGPPAERLETGPTG